MPRAEDAEAFAAELAAHSLVRPYSIQMSTSISSLLMFAGTLFDGGDASMALPGTSSMCQGMDLDNAGPPVAGVRDALVAAGVTINGLALAPVRSAGATRVAEQQKDGLQAYFEHCVMGGPGAFVMGVHDMSDISAAIRRKLLAEIVAGIPVLIPASSAQGPSAVMDCRNEGEFPGR